MDETQSTIAESNKPKSKKLLIILIGLFILIIIIAIGIILFINSKSREGVVTEDESKDSGTETPSEDYYGNGDEILKQACKTALPGYPNWASETEIVLIENNESTNPRFFYRESPESSSVSIAFPLSEGEELADIGLVDLDTILYTKFKTGSEKGIEIGMMKFLGSTSITPVYTNDEIDKVYDACYFSDDKVLLLYSTSDSNMLISEIRPESGEEEIISEFDANNDVDDYYAKAAVSPNSNYAYAIHSFEGEYQNSLLIVDLSLKKIIKNIDKASDPVWVGKDHILFSSQGDDNKVLLYSIEGDKIYQITAIASNAYNFSFNPNNEGIIGYNLDDDTYIMGCQTFQTIASYEGSTFEAFTNDKTAIITAASDAMNGTGFWRFENNWTVVISDDMRFYSSRPMLATSFGRY